jgi:hypothetical protein
MDRVPQRFLDALKGVPLGPQPIEHTQTWDMDGAAANFPDLKIVYGSEAPIFHPQWALRAFMDFEIPADLCAGYGYPPPDRPGQAQDPRRESAAPARDGCGGRPRPGVRLARRFLIGERAAATAEGSGAQNLAMMLLVPSDVLRPRRVDEHFAAEADAARAAGHQVALVDHDALTRGEPHPAVTRVPAHPDAVYRGWMLDSGSYAGFAAALAGRGVRLRTGPQQYRCGHEFPGWYPALAPFTPMSAWTAGTDRATFDAARRAVGSGPGVLRDYTKSMKHYWHEAAYIPDLADAAGAWSIARRLCELRAEGLTGGFVLRRFEHFTGAEVRTWWIDGVCQLVTAHPDTPDQLPPAEVQVPGLAAAIAGLGLPFVTVDLARRADGVWRVIELGDGQVSDRPTTTPADPLIAVLSSPGPPASG